MFSHCDHREAEIVKHTVAPLVVNLRLTPCGAEELQCCDLELLVSKEKNKHGFVIIEWEIAHTKNTTILEAWVGF